jgi:hypothetical protein
MLDVPTLVAAFACVKRAAPRMVRGAAMVAIINMSSGRGLIALGRVGRYAGLLDHRLWGANERHDAQPCPPELRPASVITCN